MVRLTREYRFFLPASRDVVDGGTSWSGRLASWTIAPYWTLRATLRGDVSQPSGYLCDIRAIDAQLGQVIEGLRHATDPARRYDDWLRQALDQWQSAGSNPWDLTRLQLCISPQFFLAFDQQDWTMLYITRQYEFSAAHRLHCPEWSDEANRATFGKCNHPAGHGHNYVLEVTLAQPAQVAPGERLSLDGMDDAVHRCVVARLDHKHLNEDIPEFSSLNPSVEQIAQVIWRWLVGHLPAGRLVQVRVYETPKTWADVTAD